jgi:STE24 endopeptidase
MAERPAVLPLAVACGGLVAALVLLIVMVTPWQPLGVPAGGRVASVPARDFTAAEHQREDGFHLAVRVPAYGSLLVSVGVAMLLGVTPLGARLAGACARPMGGGWPWQVLFGGLAVLLAGRLVTLPLAAWSEVVRRDYGLSTRAWSGWAADLGKGFAVSSGVTLLALLALLGLVRAMPRWWWAPASLGAAALTVLLSFAYPLVVEPLFNTFTPMSASALRSDLLELARRDGVAVEDVLVADASRRTTALNAYVSGFGGTRRIVVYDTLLDSAPPAQVELVVAHELGHAAEHDVPTGTAVGAVGVAAGVCAVALLLRWPALLGRAGVATAADGRAVALLIALMAVGALLASPAESLVSRRIEARADLHALDLTRDAQTFALMQRRLALRGLSDLDPSPLEYAWFATHPTAPERIAMARAWASAHGVPVPPDLARQS